MSDDLLETLDALSASMSSHALEFGWIANAYFEVEKENLIDEFGSEAAALTETITFIHEREAKYVAARKTVAERMRVARWMTSEKYNDIVEETGHHPSFHQVRACLVTNAGEIDNDACEEMLAWCVENEWPTVEEIREHRDGKDMRTPAQKHWDRFVRMAGVVSRDYADRTDRWQAAHIVIAQDDKERGHADILP